MSKRLSTASVVSVWLRRAGGDAGAMMLDAYRQILSETEPAVRTVMLEFLESVRIHYIASRAISEILSILKRGGRNETWT
ncbi:hypothetical protein FOT53_24485 [Citrobacter freundii]|nr:hypothetical protein [Citrobacter freundii]